MFCYLLLAYQLLNFKKKNLMGSFFFYISLIIKIYGFVLIDISMEYRLYNSLFFYLFSQHLSIGNSLL